MSAKPKIQYFADRLRRSMQESGIAPNAADSLLCPLCWQELPIAQFSIEHVVPSKVGGRPETLTCTMCNNLHGRTLDCHIVGFQKAKDQVHGLEPMPVNMDVLGHKMAADLHWSENHKSFSVVGKATNPQAIEQVQGQFDAGNVAEFCFTMPYGYSPSKFHLALLRSAYLILFHVFGYRYARQSLAQLLRLRIHNPMLQEPDLGPMIIGLNDFQPSLDRSYFVLPCKVLEMKMFLTIIRLKRKTASYMGVYMPGFECDDAAKFFETLERYKQISDGKRISITVEDVAYCG